MVADLVCKVCGGVFGADAIEDHLPACLKKAGAKGRRRCREETFVVTAKWSGKRLIVRMAASSDLECLEDLIRQEWFSWDHLSAFVIDGRDYAWNKDDAETRGVPLMSETKAGDVLHDGLRFKYEYDFGSVRRAYLAVRSVPAGAGPAMKGRIYGVAEHVKKKAVQGRAERGSQTLDGSD